MSKAKNSQSPRPRIGRDFNVPGPIGIAGEPTLEEWNEVRQAAFDELRKLPIPESLIQAVQEFRPHAEVVWITEQGNLAGPNEPAEPVVQPPKEEINKETTAYFDELPLNLDDLSNDSFPRTAGDALGACLRSHLAELRCAGAAPVRFGKMLPRSTIATIAMDILETNQLFGNVPGEELIQLLRELLDVDRPKANADRQFAARYKAAWILAQDERVPTRELARKLGVNASSISRWLREPAFRQRIQDNQSAIRDLKSRGLWPPKLKDQERSDLIARRKKLLKLHDAIAAVGSALKKMFASAQKPIGRRVREARELVRRLNELETSLKEIEAEIKGIDSKLAPVSEGTNPTL
jgi:hypothetical protein